MTTHKLTFPDHGDPKFASELSGLREYQMYKVPMTPKIHNKDEFEAEVANSCFGFEKTLYQNLMAHYLSRRSPYKSLMLFHSLGTGKSCSAITIAESLLQEHIQKDGPKILVVASSVLQKSFEDQIFSYTQLMTMQDITKQCNGDLYTRLLHGIDINNIGINDKEELELIRKRVHNIIKSRYKFLTYGDVVEYNKKNPIVTDKVIIVDEAHNLRISETEKKAADALEKLIENGKQNRVVLLTATPMYNEPEEIFWLLSLLLKNDKITPLPFKQNETIKPSSLAVLKQLASEYISYIKSANPFTFGVKLGPKDIGVKVLDEPWTRIDGVADLNSIVYTPLGKEQKKIAVLKEKVEEKDITSSFIQLELSNIKYATDQGGNKGFKTIFNIAETATGAAAGPNEQTQQQLKVYYKKGYENYLAPENLGNVAAKMKKICEFVATSEGIVIVYSQFAWSGIVPMAIALEHIGFQRYGGNNILNRTANTTIKNTTFDGIPFPNYCILSTDPHLMGTGSSSAAIDKLVKTVNAQNNIHGEKIKVILMTKVASEGLSFRNVREVHIMDPWYHMNRIEQVCGRAIRTCSHTDLPLEERNITIFMHVTSEADIRAYKISARKLKETQEVENLIRDSAVDCNLLINVNYYPKNIFDFQVVLRTSQKKQVLYNFGDNENKKPKCNNGNSSSSGSNAAAIETKPVTRKEVSKLIIPTLLKRMQKYIDKNNNINNNQATPTSYYINVDDLKKYIGSVEEVALETIYQGIYPNRLINGYMIYPHLGKLVIIPDEKKEVPILLQLPEENVATSAPPKTRAAEVSTSTSDTTSESDSSGTGSTTSSTSTSSDNKEDATTGILNTIELNDDEHISLLSAYSTIDSDSWFNVAKRLIESTEDRDKRIAELFASQGALINKTEVTRLKKEKTKYVGFVNIFNVKAFEVILYDAGKYIKASETDVTQIKAKRTEVTRESLAAKHKLYGILDSYRFSKNKTGPYRFTFKIVAPDVGKKGEICTSKRDPQLREIMDKLKIPVGSKVEGKKTKDQYCYSIMYNLSKQGKLFTYPEWKP